MNASTITEERTPQDPNSNVSPPDEPISRWLKAEMKVAGRKDLPIHIDTDIEIDDDDVAEEQPRHFLLTEERKKMIKDRYERALVERQEVYAIRRLRRQARQNREEKRREMAEKKRRLREKKRARQKWNRSLARLPAELILELIRHTQLCDLQNFLLSGKTIYNIFRENEAAIPPAIEATQFSGFKWLFGSGRRRSTEQKRALIDYISTHRLTYSPELIPEISDKIEQGRFADWSALDYFQELEGNITDDVEHRRSMGMDMTRRTALCLRAFSNCLHDITPITSSQSRGNDNMPGKAGWEISVKAMPMEDRVKLFERQPAATQANIREVLEKTIILIIGYLDQRQLASGEPGDYPLMGQETRDWIACYYSLDKVDRKMRMEDMGKWIAGLAAGYILEVLLPSLSWIGRELEDIAAQVRVQNGFFRDALDRELHNSGSTDGFWKESRDFADRIGLDLGKILEGTAVGGYFGKLSWQRVCLEE